MEIDYIGWFGKKITAVTDEDVFLTKDECCLLFSRFHFGGDEDIVAKWIIKAKQQQDAK